MNLKDIVRNNRSYRRFYQDETISEEQLIDFIDHSRISPSARNGQVLKYFISNETHRNQKIFEQLAWAGYLKNWNGPEQGERPSAYIIMMVDTSLSKNYYCDDGIAAQTIMLAASEIGFGGCIIAAIKKNELHNVLQLPHGLEIILVLALGKPKEKVVLEEIKDGDFKYWRDKDGVHHVPKRNLDEIIVNIDL